LAGGAGLVISRAAPATGTRGQGPEKWALVSDPHVAADVTTARKDANMADNIRRAAAEILAMEAPPAGVIVNGDCAHRSGQVEDYRTFLKLFVDPLVAKKLPVHLTLGNHDNRERFLRGVNKAAGSAVEGRLVSVLRGRHANVFLLDTLDRTGEMSGTVGDRQVAWLDKSLAAMNDLPAVVTGHHPLADDHPFRERGGIRDSKPLWDVLRRHRHVKAYLFGHNHFWGAFQRDGIHLVNLPSTAWTFLPVYPTGWVEMTLEPKGAELRVHRIGGGELPGETGIAKLAWA
jgi:3',5'-cyclic AMP phosphodiesterase CpdA